MSGRAPWVQLRRTMAVSAQHEGAHADADVYPDFDHNLHNALQRETEMLFESVVLEDKPVTTLLDADYTFINERLARHYGVPNVTGRSSGACLSRTKCERDSSATAASWR